VSSITGLERDLEDALRGRLPDASAQELRLEEESVNDHLRLLAGAPLTTVTGGLHEVKPWFGGKLDFAPSLHFAGDGDFPLMGGAPGVTSRGAGRSSRRRASG
jgi:hypothetical protein